SKDRVSDFHLLSKTKGTTSVDDDFEYIKLNAGEHGFYRSMYDHALLARLLVALENQTLSVINQLGLLRDLTELCKGGLLSTDVYLETLTYVADKQSYVTWMEIGRSLGEINNITGESEPFDEYALSIFKPVMHSLGYEKQAKETTSRSLLRTIAMSSLAKYGDKKTINYCEKLFAKHLKGAALPADLRMVVYGVVAQNGGMKEFKQLKTLFEKATMSEERNRLGEALFMFHNEDCINSAVEFAFSDGIKSQDLPIMIHRGFSNSHARNIMWNTITSRWDEILVRFQKGSLLGTIIAGAGYFTTDKDYKKVELFYKKSRHAGSEQAVAKALENIKINGAWFERDVKLITSYLKNASK
ncbi:MAG: ERAP1-like C-terminal domain-containing protein, partial [bacterium]|nr:ERAP1-like C-terminal domain-containing protein [bacterium]